MTKFDLDGEWPGLLKGGNLDLLNRPSVPNPDGGMSSVHSMSIGVGGKEYLIPRVSEDGHLLSEKEAIDTFHQTGNHLGIFDTPESATAYAGALHEQQAALGTSSSFDEEFKKAVQNPLFLKLSDDHKRTFVNHLMDQDETVVGLSPEHRQAFLSEYINANKSKPEPTFSQQAGAFAATPVGQGLMPGAANVLSGDNVISNLVNKLGGMPIAGPGAVGGTGGAIRAVGSGLGGLDIGKDIVTDTIKQQLDRGSAASGVEKNEYETGVFGQMADLVDASMKLYPRSPQAVDSYKDIDSIKDFGNWLAGGAGQTFGYLAPAMAASALTGGTSTLPWMAAILTGDQRLEVLEESGRIENPGVVAVSGIAQAALERLFGPESRIGQNLFRSGVRELLDKASARAATRVGLEALGEAGTEGLQEWVNQQVGEWSTGDRGWWNNLEPEDKQQVLEGAALGGFVGGMVAVPGNVSHASMEKRFEAITGLLKDFESLTAEERGALGIFDPRNLRKLSTASLTENQAAEIRLENAPDFLETTEEQNQFVQGTLDESRYSQEQIVELREAEAAIVEKVNPSDVAVEAAEPDTVKHGLAANEIIEQAKLYANILEEEGETGKAANMRKAADTFELVKAKDKELRTLAGLIGKFGVKIQFYRSEGDIGISGVSVGTDTILVRWDSTAPELVARKAIHEAVHSIAHGNPEAELALHDVLKEHDADLVKSVGEYVDKVYDKRGMDLSAERKISETVARITEKHSDAIFKAMRSRAVNEKTWSEKPGIVGRVGEAVYSWLAKMSREHDSVKKIIGNLPKELDPQNRREFSQLMDKLIGYLESRGEEAAIDVSQPDITLGKKPTKVPEKIPPSKSTIKLQETEELEPPEAKVETPAAKPKAAPVPPKKKAAPRQAMKRKLGKLPKKKAARVTTLENMKATMKDGGTLRVEDPTAEAVVREVFGNAVLKNGVVITVKGKEEQLNLFSEEEGEVEKLETDPDFSLDISAHQRSGTGYAGYSADTKTFNIFDTKTEMHGTVSVTERYIGTEDQEAYVEWVGVDRDDDGNPLDGNDRFLYLGIRKILALRDKLRPFFPNSLWIGGYRIGGTHSKAYEKTGKMPYTRIPLMNRKMREMRGIVFFDSTKKTQGDLDLEHGEWDPDLVDPEEEYNVAVGSLDRLIEVREQTGEMSDLGTALDILDSQAVTILTEEEGIDQLLENFGAGDSQVDHSFDWEGEKPDYVALEKKYGISNLAGMSKLVKITEDVSIPGGIDGTFTYEELIWLKEQGIDISKLSEEVHLKLHRKIVRTMQPSKPDSLQVLNNFIFSMLSPNAKLTDNELAYAMSRIRNNEESKEWAIRIPWDAPSGEIADLDSYLKHDKNNEALNSFMMEEWDSDSKHPKVADPEHIFWADPVWFRRQYRAYYNKTIAEGLGLQSRTKGGAGVLGSSDLTNIAELNQYYQIDSEWFMMQESDVDENGAQSWHMYVERLSTQFRGMDTKVASFAAVWQDPLQAAVSAVDRHMGRMFEAELFNTDRERWKWERDVIRRWNRENKTEKIKTLDELFLINGGDGHFVKRLMKKLGTKQGKLFNNDGSVNKKLPKRWQEFGGTFLSMPESGVIRLMSDHYKNALEYNAEQAQNLQLGLFASQWFLWDRYRRRLEPHEIVFPGLYKLPRLSKERIASVRKSHSSLGYFDTRSEIVETETGPEAHLKRVRSAPSGSLTYWSFDEGPAHFPPQSGMRTPLYNAHQADPGAQLDPQSGPMWSIPDESWIGWIRRRVQDKFFRVRILQEVIERQYGSIHDDMDPYLHEMLYHGRAASRIGEFEHKFVVPLMKYIRKNNIDIEDFEFWLHARHAEERNSHYREVWYTRKKERLEKEIINIKRDIEYNESRGSDTDILKRRLKRKQENLRKTSDKSLPDSGMSTKDARTVMEEYGDRYDDVAKLFDSMMDRKLQVLFEGGLITANQLKSVNKYKHYVPLKGKNYEGDLEDLLDVMGIATGRGFDIRGDELGFAFGREPGEHHTHPILPQAIIDIEEAIIRAEKNRVAQAFLALIEEFPNESIYEINKSVKRRVWDKTTGEVKLVEDAFAKFSDNVLAIKKDGETYYVTIKDARLASAMKNIGSDQMGVVLKIAASINRFLAKVNTTLNPEFMVANFLRDIQTAGFNLSSEEYKSIRNAALSGVSSAANGIRKAEGFTTAEEADVESDEMVKWYREFVEEGGQIGFFGYNDVLSKAKSIHRHMKLNGPGLANATMRRAMQIGSLVERGNTVVENATRLSAYVAARKAGMSKKKAAGLARNLTVNFNKKGESGQIINAIWLFSNASIQGTFRMGHAVLHSPSIQRMVAAQVMGSFAMAALNRGIAGEDDEDGMNYWDKLGDWQKERNFVVMMPGNGDHIKIPLPYGYNIFHVLGTELERLVHEGTSGRMKGGLVVKSGINVLNALMSAFNPLGGSSLDSKWTSMRFVVPSQIAPIADTLVNETYYGAPIQPVRSSWDHSPASERHFNGVSPLAEDLTKWLNKFTGGSEYESGWIDMNPEVLGYIVSSYAGAGAKTAERFVLKDAAWLAKAVAGVNQEKLPVNDIVFLRRVYGEQNDNTVAAVFYENMDDLKQGAKAYDNLKAKELNDWRKKNQWMVPLFKKMKEAEKGIRATDDTDAKNKIRKRFNRYYREAWLRQF